MCEATPAARADLPADSSAPRAARAFLREASCDQHHAAVLDDAELLTSELVTNAVVHGAPPVSVEVECDRSRGLQVRVTDGSPTSPRPRSAGPADLDGRGMALVDLLSEDWGAQPSEAGKSVWFLLRPRPHGDGGPARSTDDPRSTP